LLFNIFFTTLQTNTYTYKYSPGLEVTQIGRSFYNAGSSYLIGGYDNQTQDFFAKVFQFDWVTMNWTRKADLNAARAGEKIFKAEVGKINRSSLVTLRVVRSKLKHMCLFL
jgi:hypothetical protein